MTLFKRNKKAFTLVELLVVISILALLIALVLPAIGNALFRGQLTTASANARSIHQSIFGKATEDVYISSNSAWPQSGDFTDSNKYLYSLITNGTLGVSFNFFTAPGLATAKTANEFTSTQDVNAWAITEDVRDSDFETMPVIMSKNLDLTNLNAMQYTGTDDVTSNLQEVKPFDRKGFVFVTKGGAGYAIQKDSLKSANLELLFTVVDPTKTGTTKVDKQVLRPLETN